MIPLATAERRRAALLVGIQAFAVEPLRHPASDVATMPEALLAIGFHFGNLTVLINAD